MLLITVICDWQLQLINQLWICLKMDTHINVQARRWLRYKHGTITSYKHLGPIILITDLGGPQKNAHELSVVLHCSENTGEATLSTQTKNVLNLSP